MKKSSFIELEGRQRRKPIQFIDLKIVIQPKNKQEHLTEQLLQKVDISKTMNNTYDSILLQQLLTELQLHYNVPVQDRQIYYYCPQGEVFVNCGVYPLTQEIQVELKEIDPERFLIIKIKQTNLLHIDRLMHIQTKTNNFQKQKQKYSDDEQPQGKGKGKKQCRRTKQRRIGYIIQKVIEWRKYYSGTSDQSMMQEKYSLQEAATKVGISKKSLDDYLFQIRFGFRYGFNFNEHYNEKVGILRDFVRQQKKATTNKGQVKRRKIKMKEELN